MQLKYYIHDRQQVFLNFTFSYTFLKKTLILPIKRYTKIIWYINLINICIKIILLFKLYGLNLNVLATIILFVSLFLEYQHSIQDKQHTRYSLSIIVIYLWINQSAGSPWLLRRSCEFTENERLANIELAFLQTYVGRHKFALWLARSLDHDYFEIALAVKSDLGLYVFLGIAQSQIYGRNQIARRYSLYFSFCLAASSPN